MNHSMKKMMSINLTFHKFINRRKVWISQILAKTHFILKLNQELRKRVKYQQWVLVKGRKMKKEWIENSNEKFRTRLKRDLNDFHCQPQNDLPENNRKRYCSDLKGSKRTKREKFESKDLKLQWNRSLNWTIF